jgi:hypothetical protein
VGVGVAAGLTKGSVDSLQAVKRIRKRAGHGIEHLISYTYSSVGARSNRGWLCPGEYACAAFPLMKAESAVQLWPSPVAIDQMTRVVDLVQV